MGTGRITDFRQPNQGNRESALKRVEKNPVSQNPVIRDSKTPAEPVQADIRVHQEVIIEGQGKIRLKKNGTPDLRFRNAPSQREWDRIKRLEDT